MTTAAQVLHFFGGKGGSGKTTLSAAFSLCLAERFPKGKVLLISLEPVGALSDLFKKKLTTKPATVVAGKGSGGLFAAELDADATCRAFLERFSPALLASVQRGSVLTDGELRQVFSQSIPGIEELAALFAVEDLLVSHAFDRIVVDSTATSHLLRLVDMPSALRRLLALAKGERQSRGAKKEPVLKAGVDEFVVRIERLAGLLRDPLQTAFHLCTLAEPVAEAQTRLLFSELRERQLPIANVVVNQVEDGTGCPACQGRRGLQAPHVRKYQLLDPAVPVQLVGKREVAPRGLDALKKLASAWASGKETKALEFSAAEGPPALVRAPSMPPIAAPPLPPTRLIFFVGHGGVGKSSCAAAAAVTLTEKEGPVLLISTDKAHSLSDVLLSRLTDTETQVKGTKGLYARELDIPGWFAGLKRRIKDRVDGAFGPEVKGQENAYDREVLKGLLDCAPFAADELAAMAVLTDALTQERFKRIVVDPAPSTDSVRILELPAIAGAWLSALHTVLRKHKVLGELADEVSALERRVKRFEAALQSPAESRFVVVTRGEELAIPRTERLVEYLKAKNLAVERVLVNRVLPKSTCPRCENRRKNELIAARVFEKRVGVPVTVAPALGRHPAGLRELKAFRTSWYALSATAKIKAA